MAWIEIERNAAANAGVALRISRQRLRNDEYLYLVRIRIARTVLDEARMAAGDAVDLLRGVCEHAGKLRVQAAADVDKSFHIIGTGSAGRLVGNIAVPSTLLGVEKPAVSPSVSVHYRAEPGAIELVLPDPLKDLRARRTDEGAHSSEIAPDSDSDPGGHGGGPSDFRAVRSAAYAAF